MVKMWERSWENDEEKVELLENKLNTFRYNNNYNDSR